MRRSERIATKAEKLAELQDKIDNLRAERYFASGLDRVDITDQILVLQAEMERIKIGQA